MTTNNMTKRKNKGGRPEKNKSEIIAKRYMINANESESKKIDLIYNKQNTIKPQSTSDFLKRLVLGRLEKAEKRSINLTADLNPFPHPGTNLDGAWLVKFTELSNTLRGIATNYNQSLKRLNTLLIPAHLQAEISQQANLLTEIRQLLQSLQQMQPHQESAHNRSATRETYDRQN